MKRIPLRDRAGVTIAYALVDDDVFARVGHLRWSLSDKGYVQRRADNVRLHRLVMGLVTGDPREVDHRDGNQLDNRRRNLRLASDAEQAQNRRGRGDSSSRFRGVSARDGRWIARVQSDGRSYNLGTFETEEEAAAAARGARRVLLPFSEEGRVA